MKNVFSVTKALYFTLISIPKSFDGNVKPVLLSSIAVWSRKYSYQSDFTHLVGIFASKIIAQCALCYSSIQFGFTELVWGSTDLTEISF